MPVLPIYSVRFNCRGKYVIQHQHLLFERGSKIYFDNDHGATTLTERHTTDPKASFFTNNLPTKASIEV